MTPEEMELDLHEISKRRLEALATIDLLIERAPGAFVGPLPVKFYEEIADVLRCDMIALAKLEAMEAEQPKQ